MYNKLFTKILDSSIWLEPVTTRIVWITLLAAMDEDGYAHFSAIENLANRARVTVTECNAAVEALMAPDQNSADPEFDGRRIERVHGGFIILNAVKYRSIFSNATRREQTRLRVRKFREKQAGNANVTQGNASLLNVTLPYACTSPSPFKEEGSGKEEEPKARGSLDEVVAHAIKIEMTEGDGRWFFKKCEGNGWRNGGEPIEDFKSTMEAWKEQGYYPSQKQGNGKNLSIQDLRSIAQAKEEKAAELKKRYCMEDGLADTWSDVAKRQEFRKIRKEIKTITERIANFA